MRRIAVVFAFSAFTLASSLAFAQTIIENPAKPDNPRAGRTVTLQEVMRIEDAGKDFYIKYVSGLKVAADGSVFINDSGAQILQFNPQGRFVRNLEKKGQGPGEFNFVYDIWPRGDQIILCGTPPKVLVFGPEGIMIQEISFRGAVMQFSRFIYADAEKYFFSQSGQPDRKGASGWREIPQEIVKVDPATGEAKRLYSFTLPGWVSTSGGGMGVTVYQSLIAVPIGLKALLVSHTSDYLIKLIQSESGSVIRQFRRVYDRIKTKVTGNVTITGGERPPAPEFWADIQAMHVVGNELWAQTSTVDPKKGFLIDVFNLEGRYIDRFYLKWSDKDVDPNHVWQQFTFSGGYVYFDDKNADGLVVIKKCRLVGL